MTRKLSVASLALVAALAACVENESLNPPTANPDLVDPLFARYVAFGNSITSGLQSGGINDSVQRLSYAVLLAEQMGTEFNYPSLRAPGCPPPLVNVFTQEKVGDAGPLGCALRNPNIPEYLNNVAFPGNAVIELLDYFNPDIVPSSTDAFRTFLLGGRTPYEAAAEVLPTFVTVAIGSNDGTSTLLDTSNPGDPAQVTSPAAFAQYFGAFMDSLDLLGSIQGGVIIGALQPLGVPYATQGRVWKGFELQFDAATAPLNALDIGNACLPGTPIPGTTDTAWTSIPFHVGGPALAQANAKIDSVMGGQLDPVDLEPVVIGCTDAEAISDTEMLNIVSATAQYNAAMAAEAAERDWLFVDPNDLLRQLAGTPGAVLPFPAFPGLPGVTPEMSQNAPFGTALSRDGFHPSTSTHVLVANALIAAINAKYGTTIPARD
jgi:lysophospholipase L1-like esterase